MIEIVPFKPYVYKSRISLRIAPPYDVIDRKYKRELLEKDKYNIVNLILPGGYEESRKFFEDWKKKGILRLLNREGIFFLKQRYNGKERAGILSSLKLKKGIKKFIVPHEKTYKKFKEDRFQLFKKVKAEFSPVFLLYKGKLGSIRKEKLFSYRLKDHTGELYGVFDEQEILKIRSFFKKRVLYIADGHQRFEVGMRLFKENKDFDRLYVYLTNIDDITIYPTHFLIEDRYLPQIFKNFSFSCKYKKRFDIKVVKGKEVFFGKAKDKFFGMEFLKNLKKRIKPEEIFYTHNEKEICRNLSKGKIGVILPEIKKEVFLRYLKKGKLFPQKTTYFFPKIPSGILIHPIGVKGE